jgi:hypothetical protein
MPDSAACGGIIGATDGLLSTTLRLSLSGVSVAAGKRSTPAGHHPFPSPFNPLHFNARKKLIR